MNSVIQCGDPIGRRNQTRRIGRTYRRRSRPKSPRPKGKKFSFRRFIGRIFLMLVQ
jgi:hypothetical protein